MFYLIANHMVFSIYGCWDYFEAGHGKDPCDGVAGNIKRQADQVAKHGVAMADADDFYRWATSTPGTVDIAWVGKAAYDTCQQQVNAIQPIFCPVRGNATLYATLKGADCTSDVWHETSCNCANRLAHDTSSCGWKPAALLKSKAKSPKSCATCPLAGLHLPR